MIVKFKSLHPDATLPFYATAGASGFDLVAIEDVIIEPGETKLIRTGLAVEVLEGFEMQVRPRSGLSLKTPLRVANAPGTVDSDYRGEVCVIMTNIADNQYKAQTGTSGSIKQIIKKGDRIAQGVICPIMRADLIWTQESLSETNRGSGGFGSTGK
jgi:dUTP pyrophosphatase